jgi:hypothetical protein
MQTTSGLAILGWDHAELSTRTHPLGPCPAVQLDLELHKHSPQPTVQLKWSPIQLITAAPTVTANGSICGRKPQIGLSLVLPVVKQPRRKKAR